MLGDLVSAPSFYDSISFKKQLFSSELLYNLKINHVKVSVMLNSVSLGTRDASSLHTKQH